MFATPSTVKTVTNNDFTCKMSNLTVSGTQKLPLRSFEGI